MIRQGGSRDRVPVTRTRRFGESSGAQLDFTRPGRPTENAFIESFDGRLRDECLNVIQFTSIEDARAKIEAWRIDYNRPRPHSSLWHRTPDEFVRQHHTTGTTDKVACSG